MEKITVVSGDTDSCVFDTGAYASSGTFFSGNASLLAAKKLKEKILAEAALQMNEKVEDLDVRAPGEVYSKTSGKALTYGELSHAAIAGDGRGQMVAHGSFVTNASLRALRRALSPRWRSTSGPARSRCRSSTPCRTRARPSIPRSRCARCTRRRDEVHRPHLYEDMKLDENGKCINANLTDYGAPMIGEAPEDFKSVLIDVNDDFRSLRREVHLRDRLQRRGARHRHRHSRRLRRLMRLADDAGEALHELGRI